MLMQLKEKHNLPNIQTVNVQYIFPWCKEPPEQLNETKKIIKYFAKDMNGSMPNNKR